MPVPVPLYTTIFKELSFDAHVVRIGPWVQNLGSKIIGRDFRDPFLVSKEAGAHDLLFKANKRKIGT